MAVLAKMNHQQWKQDKKEKHTHTHKTLLNPKQNQKELTPPEWASMERDRIVTGNACLVTHSTLNTLLTVRTCPQESWSENTLLNNVILWCFNENVWFCSFFSLLQMMVAHLPVKQVFTHQKFLWILMGFCISHFFDPCPTRINDCQDKEYLYLCFPIMYYSGHSKSVGTFMWMPSYKPCPSPLTDSKGKKHTTITHGTEQNKTKQSSASRQEWFPWTASHPRTRKRGWVLSLFFLAKENQASCYTIKYCIGK